MVKSLQVFTREFKLAAVNALTVLDEFALSSFWPQTHTKGQYLLQSHFKYFAEDLTTK